MKTPSTGEKGKIKRSNKSSVIYKRIYDKVFEAQVFFVLAEENDMKEVWKKLRVVDADNITNGRIGLFTRLEEPNGAVSYLLWMREPIMKTLVHEITHLVNCIFNDKGVFYNFKENEVFAYYTEYWYEQLSPLVQKGIDKQKEVLTNQRKHTLI